MIKIHFWGANRQVTGSRYLLETPTTKVAIDCGMFQEREFLSRNWNEPPISPESIDALVLTHAHIDHCGLIPRLVSQGFNNPIHCTRPTVELAEILLRDAARIQVEDAAYKKRRHKREGRKSKYPEIPLYDEDDARAALPLLKGNSYGHPVQLGTDVRVTFFDAGHILGSSSLEFQVGDADDFQRIVFSGDIGQCGKPIIRDPVTFKQADYVVMESTYGDRDHEDRGDIESQLEEVINSTLRKKGNVLIPTFAIERAQELMYYVARLVHDRRIPTNVRVFLDSPMAVDATEVFRQHRDAFDAETWELISEGTRPLQFPGLTLSKHVSDSKAINDHDEPCVIMSTSGMCTAGRIKHHLRRNIGRSECTILFVGYQAHGTLGRQISDGNKTVRIHGRQHEVRASVDRIYGFSGHADRGGLLRWAGALEKPPQCTFLTHGEEDAANELSSDLRGQLGWKVVIPEYGDVLELTTSGAH